MCLKRITLLNVKKKARLHSKILFDSIRYSTVYLMIFRFTVVASFDVLALTTNETKTLIF